MIENQKKIFEIRLKMTETETEIIIDGDLILEKDFETEKNLKVRGRILGKDGNRWNINAWDINARNINARNINAWDINAWDINAWDINARNIDAQDIICETRKKKSVQAKTKARIYIKNRSKIERKEYDD